MRRSEKIGQKLKPVTVHKIGFRSVFSFERYDVAHGKAMPAEVVGTVDIEPVSFLEAISVGICPVLTDSPRSAVSGFALDPRNVYDHRSSKDLAKHIDYWYEHPLERKQNADSYLGYADKFDFQRSMDAMEKMFLETIDEYRHNHQEALELKEKEA